MAAVLRVGIVGLASKATKPLGKTVIPALTQTCGIAGKVLRDTYHLKRPAPYPYKTKDYGFIAACFDKTTKRFDDNSKVSLILATV
jgi:NADH dehydrogenase (ubiquinone) 1 alpha subcomplex subunit 10